MTGSQCGKVNAGVRYSCFQWSCEVCTSSDFLWRTYIFLMLTLHISAFILLLCRVVSFYSSYSLLVVFMVKIKLLIKFRIWISKSWNGIDKFRNILVYYKLYFKILIICIQFCLWRPQNSHTLIIFQSSMFIIKFFYVMIYEWINK